MLLSASLLEKYIEKTIRMTKSLEKTERILSSSYLYPMHVETIFLKYLIVLYVILSTSFSFFSNKDILWFTRNVLYLLYAFFLIRLLILFNITNFIHWFLLFLFCLFFFCSSLLKYICQKLAQ